MMEDFDMMDDDFIQDDTNDDNVSPMDSFTDEERVMLSIIFRKKYLRKKGEYIKLTEEERILSNRYYLKSKDIWRKRKGYKPKTDVSSRISPMSHFTDEERGLLKVVFSKMTKAKKDKVRKYDYLSEEEKALNRKYNNIYMSLKYRSGIRKTIASSMSDEDKVILKIIFKKPSRNKEHLTDEENEVYSRYMKACYISRRDRGDIRRKSIYKTK